MPGSENLALLGFKLVIPACAGMTVKAFFCYNSLMPPKRRRKTAGYSKRRKTRKKTKRKKRKYRSRKKSQSQKSTFVFLLAAAILAGGIYHLYTKTPAFQGIFKDQSKTAQKSAVQSQPKPKSKVKTLSVKPKPKPRPKKKRVFSNKPKIVFVIDDMGYTREHEKELKKLGSLVTYAVLPKLKYSGHFGRLSRETGAEVILHLPLESQKGTIPGKGLITSQMKDSHILEVLRKDLDSVPYRIGVNNHMGSLGTSDPRVMRVVLKELKRKGYFFLDSYTTSKSVTGPIARGLGLPFLKRDVFLDNEDKQPYIRQQVQLLAKVARKRGYAIGIGHYRYNTFKVLQSEIKSLRKKGYVILSLQDLNDYLS